MLIRQTLLASALVACAGTTYALPFFNPSLDLKPIGTYHTGMFAKGAAEIVVHDARNHRLLVVNAQASAVDVLDIRDPSHPQKVATIDAKAIGASANSVAVHDGLIAVAIEAVDRQAAGKIAFYDAESLVLLKTVTVGALPDMVTFAPNGRFVLVANEGEPNADYTNDPEGSVSVIDLRRGVAHATVRTAGFSRYIGQETQLKARGIRLFGPGANAAQDLEPEYITVADDSRTAWVTLQENNAIARIDVLNARILDLKPLGTKDHSLAMNALDASDRDSSINIASWPVAGMYMPDAISNYSFFGQTFLVTANEGDARDYDGYSEEARVKDLVLDPVAYPDAAALQQNATLARMKTTTATGDTDSDGDVDLIHTFGGRSFSIRNAAGEIVFDSGADFEQTVARLLPAAFNSDNAANNSFDSRSDDKGPEPEGIALGRILGHTYAFIGLERVGGVMVYDVTNPYRVRFVTYANNRDFNVPATLTDGSSNPLAGDMGPEGLAFIPAWQSPNGKPLLVVGNEISGTTTLYQVDRKLP